MLTNQLSRVSPSRIDDSLGPCDECVRWQLDVSSRTVLLTASAVATATANAHFLPTWIKYLVQHFSFLCSVCIFSLRSLSSTYALSATTFPPFFSQTPTPTTVTQMFDCGCSPLSNFYSLNYCAHIYTPAAPTPFTPPAQQQRPVRRPRRPVQRPKHHYIPPFPRPPTHSPCATLPASSPPTSPLPPLPLPQTLRHRPRRTARRPHHPTPITRTL